MSEPSPRRKLTLPRFLRPRQRQPRPRRARGVVREVLGDARRALRRYSLLRDVLAAVLVVGLLTGGIAGATGGVWPPVLAVESGSMMHATLETPYGRVGTIDVGDLVFVRATSVEDVALWAAGGEHRYGRPGDVIAFRQDGDSGPDNLTILHRAITFVTVTPAGPGRATYSFPWLDGQTLSFGPAGIYFPPLGFDETYGFTPANGYRPAYSGFVTKGDNPVTNPAADQALGISRIVHPEWLVGEIYGEIPWMGLAKLTLQSGRTNPEVPGWERIGNAFAPIELWSMFFLVVAILVLVPFAIGTWRLWRESERRRRALSRPVPDHVARGRVKQPPPSEGPSSR